MEPIAPEQQETILTVEDLHVHLWTRTGVVHAVNGISLEVQRGEVLGIVGESGSGKTMAMLAVMGLLDASIIDAMAGRVTIRGSVWNDLRAIDSWSSRSPDLAMIFQDAMSALNPVLNIGGQMVETLMARQGLSRAESEVRALELLQSVRISDPERCILSYPHQLSGGMCQRVMIAMAVGCEPRILIADEPTTALDVTVQAQILALISDIRRTNGMSVVMISHDLGVIAGIADRVHVMYAGRIVEKGTTAEIFHSPQHPYTKALLSCTSRIDQEASRPRAIPGSLPDMRKTIVGCPFVSRCSEAVAICEREEPFLEEYPAGTGRQSVACWRRRPGYRDVIGARSTQ